MEILQEIWKQNLRPRAVVGYGVKLFLPSPPNYVTRSPGWITRSSMTDLTPLVHNLSHLASLGIPAITAETSTLIIT